MRKIIIALRLLVPLALLPTPAFCDGSATAPSSDSTKSNAPHSNMNDCVYRGSAYSEGARICVAHGVSQVCLMGQWTGEQQSSSSNNVGSTDYRTFCK